MSHSLAEIQRAFRAALLDPTAPVPDGIVGRDGRPDEKRFAVYRNNVAVSLIEALKARFPVTCRLVGEACFVALARDFVAAHPPRSPLIHDYGGDFAEFIAPLPPSEDVPYLADIARLEDAWNVAYNAAEAEPLALRSLAAIPGDRLADIRVSLHPTLRLVVSAWPVASIWHAHQGDGEPTPPARWHGENVLVVRPDADVALRCLPPGAVPFIEALSSGRDLGAAAAAALAVQADFDPGAALVELIEIGAVTEIERPTEMENRR